jgi:phosphopantetheine adenylyltransferase
LKDTYSVKKTKDLVNTQIEKYKKIAESTINDSQGSSIIQGSQNIDFISETEKQSMNDDLMNLANSL